MSRVDCCGCESQCLISRPDDQHITSIDYVKLHKAARHHAQSIVTPLGGLQQHHIFSIPSLCLFCWRDVKFRRVSTATPPYRQVYSRYASIQLMMFNVSTARILMAPRNGPLTCVSLFCQVPGSRAKIKGKTKL